MNIEQQILILQAIEEKLWNVQANCRIVNNHPTPNIDAFTESLEIMKELIEEVKILSKGILL